MPRANWIEIPAKVDHDKVGAEDEAWTNVAMVIKRVVREMVGASDKPAPQLAPPSPGSPLAAGDRLR